MALNRLKDKLLSEDSKDLKEHIQVSVVNWDEKNAFALPGGHILMTKALISGASKEQALGVLAHEVAHVKQRHVLGEYVRGTLFSWGFALIIGDYTSGLVVDPAFLENVIQLSFSRDAEAEADLVALELLDESGYDHKPLGAFLKSLSKEHDETDDMAWFSSHPASEERFQVISAYERQNPVSTFSIPSFSDHCT